MKILAARRIYDLNKPKDRVYLLKRGFVYLVPLENFPAFTVQDAQCDRFGWELEICGGDDCG